MILCAFNQGTTGTRPHTFLKSNNWKTCHQHLSGHGFWRVVCHSMKVLSVSKNASTCIQKPVNQSLELTLRNFLKWDSVSRKWNEMESFVCAIKLLMIDEVCVIGSSTTIILHVLPLNTEFVLIQGVLFLCFSRSRSFSLALARSL